jgi:hypothetical protein
MIAIGLLFVRMLCDFFKPRPRLEAEILILRHQLADRVAAVPGYAAGIDPALAPAGRWSARGNQRPARRTINKMVTPGLNTFG